ncbi:hypothetical protein RclHR1_05040009 [Rhizophagus clarus]|uniref:RBR-type E3 ubiquitin transferase n=1 Tax=Rhizophagus clarus TaxID=94130 RepID=A0A2Z6RK61_9GLOM|nr:hypothetical protein RclHR1_05040009 [Rhizophagus clarus]GES87513.1 hypothetical protein GLOIN_2v1505167 [Rhizophagus clarus]
MDLYECDICCEKENRDFRKITSKCKHKAVVCVECVNKCIEKMCIEKHTVQITCPTTGCDKSMERDDVKNIATKEIFKRYDYLSFKLAIQKIPEFRWCQASCGSGQVHKGDDLIFICEACDAKSCYNCKVLWHEDQTCKEYEIKKSNQDFATEAYLSATKRCPSCGMYIEKIDKCDHMTCICSYQFCILCLHKHPHHKPTCVHY